MTKSASSLSEQAVNEITNMILVERRFRPGDKLPNELELAEELGISRITLREAIRVLCTRGLVEIQRGRGTFVLSGGPVFALGNGPDLSAAQPRELLEFLLCTVPEAARRAAERAEETELQQLEALCREMEAEATRGQSVVKQEEGFLYLLSAASRNPVFSQILPPVSRALFGGNAFRDSPALAVPDQREILRALASHAPELARAAAQTYLLHLCQENEWENG